MIFSTHIIIIVVNAAVNIYNAKIIKLSKIFYKIYALQIWYGLAHKEEMLEIINSKMIDGLKSS